MGQRDFSADRYAVLTKPLRALGLGSEAHELLEEMGAETIADVLDLELAILPRSMIDEVTAKLRRIGAIADEREERYNTSAYDLFAHVDGWASRLTVTARVDRADAGIWEVCIRCWHGEYHELHTRWSADVTNAAGGPSGHCSSSLEGSPDIADMLKEIAQRLPGDLLVDTVEAKATYQPGSRRNYWGDKPPSNAELTKLAREAFVFAYGVG